MKTIHSLLKLKISATVVLLFALLANSIAQSPTPQRTYASLTTFATSVDPDKIHAGDPVIKISVDKAFMVFRFTSALTGTTYSIGDGASLTFDVAGPLLPGDTVISIGLFTPGAYNVDANLTFNNSRAADTAWTDYVATSTPDGDQVVIKGEGFRLAVEQAYNSPSHELAIVFTKAPTVSSYGSSSGQPAHVDALPTVVPEPATIWLLFGALGLFALRRKRTT